MFQTLVFRLLMILGLTGLPWANADHAWAQAGPFPSTAGPIVVQQVAGPFAFPWAVAFLPADNAMLVTERDGNMRLVTDGRISAPLDGVPDVWANGQGGLLDVVLSPDFSSTQRVFFTYSEPASLGRARTALASGILDQSSARPQLKDVEVLFQQAPMKRGGRHFGSRIVFAPDGTLFVTLGDRGDPPMAQALDNHIGKVVRLNSDGSVPADNPFVGQPGVKPEIWSYGHRNAQAAVLSPDTGTYFTISHGARGGDEVNQPQAGKNYGWPSISYGTEYSGRPFPGAAREGMEQPLFFWDPSIAPSGATIYDGDMFPEWRGDLFVGALAAGLISRLERQGNAVREVERLIPGHFGRIRDVRTGPDGAIWFL
ncbi:MAG: PQQ-dependent sugar dehydrogenase, partial [Pseudomonadota bacterium]